MRILGARNMWTRHDEGGDRDGSQPRGWGERQAV